MKALSNVAILQLLKEMGAGLDTVSIQEVRLHAGYDPEKYFTQTEYLSKKLKKCTQWVFKSILTIYLS
jgi:diaminopimelate decarboxylase